MNPLSEFAINGLLKNHDQLMNKAKIGEKNPHVVSAKQVAMWREQAAEALRLAGMELCRVSSKLNEEAEDEQPYD